MGIVDMAVGGIGVSVGAMVGGTAVLVGVVEGGMGVSVCVSVGRSVWVGVRVRDGV